MLTYGRMRLAVLFAPSAANSLRRTGLFFEIALNVAGILLFACPQRRLRICLDANWLGVFDVLAGLERRETAGRAILGAIGLMRRRSRRFSPAFQHVPNQPSTVAPTPVKQASKYRSIIRFILELVEAVTVNSHDLIDGLARPLLLAVLANAGSPLKICTRPKWVSSAMIIRRARAACLAHGQA